MRPLRFVLPVLFLASLALPCVKATAVPPTKTVANNAKNQRVTLYSNGEVVAVLMFYRTHAKAPQFVLQAHKIEVSKTVTTAIFRLKGNVSITRGSAKEGKGITLTADEAVIETLPDRPLPQDF